MFLYLDQMDILWPDVICFYYEIKTYFLYAKHIKKKKINTLQASTNSRKLTEY